MRKTIGRYRILGEIGRGGMGVVYKAYDPRIDRVVAIKTIRKDLYRGDEAHSLALSRFEREARAAGKLSHPGIVTVYDVGEDSDDVYIAMEFVEGVSLRVKMRAERKFSVPEVVHTMIQVCDALGYAHARGVTHRDVKPDNILCLADGSVKLADFGIARVATATATQTAVGSPRYMAPEQWRGDPVDGRTDLFAVGVMLHELLTGAPPFGGRTGTELMYAVLNDTPQIPSQIDPALPKAFDSIVHRALSREPSARYQSASEMALALEELVAAPATPSPHAQPVRLTILRRGDVHFVDLSETETLIPRSETRVDAAFMQDIAGEVERVAAGRSGGRGAETRTISGTAEAAPIDRVSDLQAIGQLIYSHLLTEPARRKIASSGGTDLYLRLDEQLVHVPWELCHDGKEFLATKFRVGRQVITERQLPRPKPAEAPAAAVLELLIVTDPTETLRGAQDECTAIESQLAALPGVHVTRFVGKDVRKVPLLQALGRSTIAHFAGHSVYDPDDPTRSGWVLSDGVLTAGEMTKLDRLPRLVFSNSCHAGATVGWDGRSSYEGHAFGIGSAFLLAGVQNYVGTFWVTHDHESALFARAFYQALLRGEPIGQALQMARKRIVDQCGWNELTWASYMLYGDPAYRLPIPRSTPARPAAGRAELVRPASTPSVVEVETKISAKRILGATDRWRWLPVAAAAVLALVIAVWLMKPAPPPETPESRPAELEPVQQGEIGEPMPADYQNTLATLKLPDVPAERKLALLQELTADESGWATIVLLETADNQDLLVSMTAIRGLSGRECGQTQERLINLLDDLEPKRRAWAAKVLGDSGCVTAIEPLSKRLEVETSTLVKDNIKVAVKKLAEKVG